MRSIAILLVITSSVHGSISTNDVRTFPLVAQEPNSNQSIKIVNGDQLDSLQEMQASSRDITELSSGQITIRANIDVARTVPQRSKRRVFYGNHCGRGGNRNQPAKDRIDACCYQHDRCWASTGQRKWSFKSKCDRSFAVCLAKAGKK